MEIPKLNKLHGKLTIPGDKSISHRAVMFGALAQGTTRITHFLEGADCLAPQFPCFQAMGIHIQKNKDEVLVEGQGLPWASGSL